jgi:hypothetical protein
MWRLALLALAACGPSASESPPATTDPTSSAADALTTAPGSSTDIMLPAGSSTGASTTGTSTTADDTSSTFIIRPDHPASWCDLFAQNCPSGQKCSFFSEDLTYGEPSQACVPLVPDGHKPGELCHFNWPGMGLDDCQKGSFCIPYDGDGAGASACVALCPDTYQCPDPDQTCIVMSGPMFWCTLPCDPLQQNCAAGLACSHESCYPTANGLFERPPGAACDYPAQCAPKSTCVPAEHVPDCPGAWCCTELCDLRAPAPCALPGQTCQPSDVWQWPLPDGIGLCALP